MQQLNYYSTLLSNKQLEDPQQASDLDEEVNILIHKLKYIPQEQRPTVLVLDQAVAFEPLFNEQLQDVVSIAGGLLIADKFDNPSIIMIVQQNESLYSEIPALLTDDIWSRTDALKNNNLFIIQKDNFGTSDDFLQEIEISAEIIQPKYFIYGRQGVDWLKFDVS